MHSAFMQQNQSTDCGERTYRVYCKCQVKEWEANPEVTASCMVLEVGVFKAKSKEAGINGFCDFS